MQTTVSLSPGSKVQYKGRNYVITSEVDLTSVLIKDELSGIIRKAMIAELSPEFEESEGSVSTEVDLASVSDDDWNTANIRFVYVLAKKHRAAAQGVAAVLG